MKMDYDYHIEEELEKLLPIEKRMMGLGFELTKLLRWVFRNAIKKIGIFGALEKKN